MNIKNLLILLVCVLTVQEMYSQYGWKKAYSFKNLDVNRISIPINNYGGLAYDDSWGFWEYESEKRDIVFDQGLWIIGKINGQVHLAHKQWNSSYSPGPIINNDAAMNVHPEDSTKYRVYKIGSSDSLSPGTDYLEWPEEMGAPVDEEGYPIIYNNQTLWTVYNGMDSSLSWRKWRNTNNDTLPVFPIEVQSLSYASNETNWIKDMVFFEWLIINKGSESIDSTYFGLWTDIDFYDATYNIPAIDTLVQLGYCWSPFDDGVYSIPLAVGYQFKLGPLKSSIGDTAIYSGLKKANYKNLELTSFHGIGDDSYNHPLYGPLTSTNYGWNIARGLDGNGNVIVDSTTGLPTKFPFAGDPVTNSGYLFPERYISGGAGFVMFSGPVTIAPQDTQWVMASLIVATGDDYKDAIQNLRLKAATIQSLSYDELVTKNSLKPSLTLLPQEFYLSQNYPNPFNNGTIINFQLPYQSNVTITIYDILGNEITTIVNGEFEAGEYSVSFLGTGLASGIYLYQFKAGQFIQTKKMILLK
jgi:hypothetical protein